MAITYTVQRATDEAGPWTDISSGIAVTNATVTGQPTGVVRWYRVATLDDGDLVEYSNPILVLIADPPTPSASGGLGADKITVSWTGGCTSLINVYRYSTFLRDWELVGEELSSSPYLDYNVSKGITYYYVVTGVTEDGYETEYSDIVSAIIPLEGIFSMSRATVYQLIQLGHEVTAGTLVAATKRLFNMEIDHGPNIPHKPVRYAGNKVATDTQRGQQHTEGRFTGVIDYNLLAYIFNSMFGTATGAAVETLGYSRTWKPDPIVPITPKTYTLEEGSVRGAEKIPFVLFNDLTLRWNQEDASIEGGFFGGKTVRGASMTALAAAADVAAMAVDPIQIGVWVSLDGSSFTRLTKVLDGEFRFGQLWKPQFHVSDLNASLDDVTELAPDFGMTLTLEEGTEANDFVTYLEGGTKIWLRLKAVGPLIEDADPDDVYHSLQITMPVFVMQPDPGDKNDVWGNTFSFQSAYDDTTKMAEIILINALLTL